MLDGAGARVEGEAVALRQHMVETQLEKRGISDERILGAFRRVPRHLFIPSGDLIQAYADHPVPIGLGQTVSQPYIVAYTLQSLELQPEDSVLEIGTGCGYQTALLAELVEGVHTIECRAELARRAQRLLASLTYDNIRFEIGDGGRGWQGGGPAPRFDAVVGSAAARDVPPILIDQLGQGGRLVMPVGDVFQELVLLRRSALGVDRRALLPVRFVLMCEGSSTAEGR